MTIEKWLSNVEYDKFGGTYIWNKEKYGSVEMVAEIRGWGSLQHKFKNQKEAEEFQDQVGEFIAQAIKEKIERDFKIE
jgi:hypothetical protein